MEKPFFLRNILTIRNPLIIIGFMGLNIKKLKKLRQNQGLSQNALERKAGVGLGILSRLEAGKGGITVDTLVKIAKALDMPPAYFLD